MAKRIKLKLVTELSVEQNLVVVGLTNDGLIEIEIPGNAAGLIMSALSGAENLREQSGTGLRSYLQTQGYELQPADQPDQIVLQLKFHPAGIARFAFPLSILRDIGEDFVKQATSPQTKIDRKPS